MPEQPIGGGAVAGVPSHQALEPAEGRPRTLNKFRGDAQILRREQEPLEPGPPADVRRRRQTTVIATDAR
jgi:hypothetical protein